MRIKTVHIHNWRSIQDVDIACERMMVFIGQNNHGKSNILTSLLGHWARLKLWNCRCLMPQAVLMVIDQWRHLNGQ
ncbi:ATP-binding protein [Planctomycetales bacterium ZRK34]|nr:ATP-binding protein [Planctomycetales bacterium ZRK34]